MLTNIINNCWKTIKYGAVVLTATFVLQTPRQAKAYDEIVHQWITELAVELLKESGYTEEYDEIVEHLPELLDGVNDEDALLSRCNSPMLDTPRYFRHFFRPLDNAGYCFDYLPGSLVNNCYQHKNSREWTFRIPNEDNLCTIYEAIDAYFLDLNDAYFKIAHTLHLIQDATLPEHAHLEAHGNVTGVINQEGFERYCTIMLQKDRLSVKKGLRPIKQNILEYIEINARIAYFLNRFPANLQDKTKSGKYLGILGKMFPSLHYQDSNQNLMQQGWKIGDSDWITEKSDGSEGLWHNSYAIGDDFWQTKDFPAPRNKKEVAGWFYIEASMQAKPKFFKKNWREQFHRLGIVQIRHILNQDRYNETEADYIPVSDGKTLAELFADELLPLAIENTAGALLMYYQITQDIFDIANKEINRYTIDIMDEKVFLKSIRSIRLANSLRNNFPDGKKTFKLYQPPDDVLQPQPITVLEANVHNSPGNERLEISVEKDYQFSKSYLKIYSSDNRLLVKKEIDSGTIISLANIIGDSEYEIFESRYIPGNNNFIDNTLYKFFEDELHTIWSGIHVPYSHNMNDNYFTVLSFERERNSNNFDIFFSTYPLTKETANEIEKKRFQYKPQQRRFILN